MNINRLAEQWPWSPLQLREVFGVKVKLIHHAAPFDAASLIRHQHFKQCKRCKITFLVRGPNKLCKRCVREFTAMRRKQSTLKYQTRSIASLSDAYCKRAFLSNDFIRGLKSFPPELIAFKREQIKLHRAIKHKTKTHE